LRRERDWVFLRVLARCRGRRGGGHPAERDGIAVVVEYLEDPTLSFIEEVDGASIGRAEGEPFLWNHEGGRRGLSEGHPW
jgi:hypothetical protein